MLFSHTWWSIHTLLKNKQLRSTVVSYVFFHLRNSRYGHLNWHGEWVFLILYIKKKTISDMNRLALTQFREQKKRRKKRRIHIFSGFILLTLFSRHRFDIRDRRWRQDSYDSNHVIVWEREHQMENSIKYHSEENERKIIQWLYSINSGLEEIGWIFN